MEGLRTHRRLKDVAEPLRSRGILHGSALANLLRDDGRMSGSLPNWSEAYGYATRVTRFAIEHMPNLKSIVCMGRKAWSCGCVALGERSSWEEQGDRIITNAHRGDVIEMIGWYALGPDWELVTGNTQSSPAVHRRVDSRVGTM